MPVPTEAGRRAEKVAATYLKRHGYRELARNWRTRWCEIDVIVQREGIMHFVEVKYRQNDTWGGGLDYITPKKLQQMYFAAEFWLAQHAPNARGYRLAAIEVSGHNFDVTAWLDDVA